MSKKQMTKCLKPKILECPKYDNGVCKSKAGCHYQEVTKNRRMTKWGIRTDVDNTGVNHPFGI